MTPIDYSFPGSSFHGVFPGKNTRLGCHFFIGELPDPGIEPRSVASLALTGVFFLSLSHKGSPKLMGFSKSDAKGEVHNNTSLLQEKNQISNLTLMVIAAMKLKHAYSLERKL